MTALYVIYDYWDDDYVEGQDWSDIVIGDNTWTQINNLEYVFVDYWDEDYISETYNYWDETTPSSNTWEQIG